MGVVAGTLGVSAGRGGEGTGGTAGSVSVSAVGWGGGAFWRVLSIEGSMGKTEPRFLSAETKHVRDRTAFLLDVRGYDSDLPGNISAAAWQASGIYGTRVFYAGAESVLKSRYLVFEVLTGQVDTSGTSSKIGPDGSTGRTSETSQPNRICHPQTSINNFVQRTPLY